MNNIDNSELTLTQSSTENVNDSINNNVTNNNINDNNGVVSQKITTALISVNWNKASDGTPIVCAITRENNLHTKTTVRSYLTALTGSNGSINFVKEKLDKGEVDILSGSKITWERTWYKAGTPHERNGQTIISDKDDEIDHIISIDLHPIAEVLLLKYLEEHPQQLSNLQERLLQKSFGVEL